MSRLTLPFLWQKSTAMTICWKMKRATSSASLPPAACGVGAVGGGQQRNATRFSHAPYIPKMPTMSTGPGKTHGPWL
jgi:hypothetical protein